MAQEKGIIQGIVLDKEMNNEPLAFTTVSIKDSKIGTTTNIDGALAFEAEAGTYTLIFSFLGYEKVELPNVVVQAGKITTIKDIIIGSIEMPFLKDIADKPIRKKEIK